MKYINLLLLFSFAIAGSANAQTACPPYKVNLLEGTVNTLLPSADQDTIKKTFPCFTGSTDDGSSMNCGGGVFDMDHAVFFYTNRDYINIRKGFKGVLSHQVFGKTAAQLIKMFGELNYVFPPLSRIRPGTIIYFDMKYGSLAFRMGSKLTAEELYISDLKIDLLEICE